MKRRDFLAGTTATSFALTLPVRAKADTRPAPPLLSAYAQNPLIEDVALSPDAKYLALTSQKDQNKFLFVVEISTKKAMTYPLGDKGDAKVRTIFFAGPNNLVIVTTATAYIDFYAGGRKEVSLAHIVDLKTNRVKTLFNDMPDFYNIVTGDVHTYQRDGQYFMTASSVNMEGEYSYELFEFSMEGLRPRKIDSASTDSLDWVLDDKGGLIARSFYDRDKSRWRVEYFKDKYWHKIYEYDSKIDYPKMLGLGRDGKSVVLVFNDGPLSGQFVELNAQGTLSEPITPDKTADRPIFHPRTKRLCGFSASDDWTVNSYFDPILAKINQAATQYFGDLRFTFYDFADDIRKVLVYYEGDKNSGAYSLMDFSTGNEIVVGTNYPEIPGDWIVQKQKITYKAADGLEIAAYLTLPPYAEGKNLPLIVYPHGGPEARDRLDFDWQVEAFASRGYAVLQPNFRGSSGYGDAFVEAGYGQWGKKMQTDLSDGVRHLAGQGIIDPKRVSICGASYGGYAALAGAAFDPSVYRCAISVAGISDVKAFQEWKTNETNSSKSSTVLYWQRLWGNVPLDTISPVKHVDAITIPILLIHGTNDTVVPIGQSRRMDRALKAAGKSVTYIEFNKEDHWQSLPSARLEMIEAIMAFLDKHNPAFV